MRFVIFLAERTFEPDANTVSMNSFHMLPSLLSFRHYHGAQFTGVDSSSLAVTALLQMAQHKVNHIWNHFALVFNQDSLPMWAVTLI